MNIHRRFIYQFFFQLITVFVLFFIILLSFWAFLGYSLMDMESRQDLSKAEDFFVSSHVSFKEEKAVFDDELKILAKEQNGWLLSINDQGKVLGTYNMPGKAPEFLKESEIASLTLGGSSGSAQYTYWELEDKKRYILFGKIQLEEQLLEQISPTVDWELQKLKLSEKIQRELSQRNGWVQLIDPEGNVVDEYGAENQDNEYTVNRLFTKRHTEESSTALHFDPSTEQAILVGIPAVNKTSALEKGMFDSLNKSLMVIFLVAFLLLLAGTLWYARKFGVPLLTLMNWIQNLGSGVYQEPTDVHDRPVTRNRKGKLKRKFRLYKELIATLSQLTETLKQNEKQQKIMAQTREEWISGLSHDLKTPLSSISGYAQMLASTDYSWSEKETREFAHIMADKSDYMMDLLEDLTLTYRLKNHALPIAKEPTDLNEFIRRIIIHYINDPAHQDKSFDFTPYPDSITASIDPKWFQRIMDNVIANAIKYNPPGTAISVTLTTIEDHLIVITIEDDGIGMESATLEKLFSRYYRGTHTGETGSGSGLGMAITKQLVHLHNGTIQGQSQPRKGTTIRIMLPTKQ
ncbi:HAMP domain-containing sensor histidine kinase [Mesobacillus jeotgali]|uniref:histidine kinase n=1 Tax=Mesobacillus jeotgali TaxID=129985 RepID=A0ABY9VIJ0_9BACI|nr:HAMP domain-containing sensor histidine kinase [Mesobacillus jeotgali]WNF23478.1 HAMP domain-containing sensor histidine kinase [Mesobacillus jeotgali]